MEIGVAFQIGDNRVGLIWDRTEIKPQWTHSITVVNYTMNVVTREEFSEAVVVRTCVIVLWTCMTATVRSNILDKGS